MFNIPEELIIKIYEYNKKKINELEILLLSFSFYLFKKNMLKEQYIKNINNNINKLIIIKKKNNFIYKKNTYLKYKIIYKEFIIKKEFIYIKNNEYILNDEIDYVFFEYLLRTG